VNAPPLSEGESAREVRFAKRDACMSRCSEGRVKVEQTDHDRGELQIDFRIIQLQVA